MTDDLFEQEYGTEDLCPKNPNGPHEPDWSSTSVESDGGTVYVDITCKHCGRSGCLGSVEKLKENLTW